MTKLCSLALLAALILPAFFCPPAHAASSASRPVFYVSPQGNDAWSGTLAAPNAAKTDGPFATLERARDAVRAVRGTGGATGEMPGAKIVVRGGTYRLTDTFTLEAQDSGTPAQPMHYVAYRGETPILCGGAAVNNWKPWKGNILQADLSPLNLSFTGNGTPWTGWGAGQWQREPISQLFFKHKRMILARYPNFDPAAPWGKGFLYIDSLSDPANSDRFKLKPSELHKWSDIPNAEAFYISGPAYISEVCKLKSIDAETGEVTLATRSWTTFRPGNRLYFQNILEELDAPGEWYWDKTKNVLYFYPPSKIAPGDVMVPTAGSALAFRDKAANILFEGFTIEAFNSHAVQISGTENCILARCTLRNIGGHGVTIDGGKRNGAEGNDIYDIGSTAVTLSGGDRKALIPAENYAVNNHIHHMGVYRKGDSAISISGCGNRVAHNTIHDIPRIGIIFGGNDNAVEYNYIHHCNLEIEDTGAIYLGGVSWTIRGNKINYNRIHDTGGYGGAGSSWHYPYFAWAIYLDDWASGAEVRGNLCYRTYLAGLHVHSGRDNIIENNIFADGQRAQAQFSAWPTTHKALPGMFKELKDMGWPEGHYKGLERMNDPIKDATMSFNEFRRNIVYYNDPNSLLYAVSGLVFSEHTSDYNTLWNHGNPLYISIPGVPREKQWARWQEMGLDTHSIIADPQFVDPAHDDYRLKPTSPALKLGFKPLPISQMGCQPGRFRATWPLVCPREIYHPELAGAQAQGTGSKPTSKAAPAGPKPRHIAPRVTSPVKIDGIASAGEWNLDPKTAMVIARAPGGEHASKYKSYAWAQYDSQNLYLLVVNEIDPNKPLMLGSQWGGQDAVEIAFRDPSGKDAPIYNLRGFAGGAKDSVYDAGASEAQCLKTREAMTFAATREKDRWVGEFCIPLAAAGIDPARVKTLQFNINVRRMADESWMVWTDTGAEIWRVETGGEIIFQR